ncbi:hypothetical protein [Aeromicrobium wangtongii]|uniref:hypothetical protein n=1 Tax=Aeromicrobium wangtongii TaxID=2969247 RepID=UPI0020172D76|nr:hypothetical protein [Aeromicrobium wangtongii]MCL3819002.1 hypothetical protein [Aeromicrobium wangtongii]
MDVDEPGWPLIDDFFGRLADGRASATVRRYARVRSRLYVFLDTADLTLVLGSDRAALLEVERQLHDGGAFWQLFGPDELACCLPDFLHEPWLPGGAQEARVQVTVVARLLALLGRASAPDVQRAREEIAARPESPAPAARLPARFRREAGWQW